MPHCADAFSLQAILAAGQCWPQALRGACCADPGAPCVRLLHAPDSRRDARSSISEILCQSSDNPLCLVFLGSITPVFSSLKQTSFDDHHCLLVPINLFSNHYTRECIHTCEKERNVAPLNSPRALYCPLLVVSACISCSPPYLLTLALSLQLVPPYARPNSLSFACGNLTLAHVQARCKF